MICPYCNNVIKNNEEKAVCFRCEIPHHKTCWERYQGCSTPDCYENPTVKANAENVGNKTITEILGKDNYPKVSAVRPKPDSVQTDNPEPKEEFQEEFKTRYKEKLDFKFRRRILLFSSIGVLSALLIVSAIFTYIKINEYYSSEDYRINQFMKTWEAAWESRDIFRYRELLDKDYQYIDKGGKAISYDERIKRVTKSFESVKNISVKVRDVKIEYESVNKNYVNVKFNQTFSADKKEEKGIKTLRLFKSDETGNQWRVFREYYE
ncbi:MAG: DUF4440 domain-containing protein [Candidatus Kapaibacterium sp.]